ncbi:MAG: type I glyceraldehyde-3-phosphate dehydrogenase [Chloroflexi bacterium]|nr:type I glyceraldehyde-3-phosphate dehydrogenase [Chloroflexota bacterium]
MPRIAINGLGRIGRATLKIVLDTPDLDVVAVNDIAPIDNIAYLIKFDTVYGRYPHAVDHTDDALLIGETHIPYYSERNPADLPWDELDVDLVFECTGLFTKQEEAGKHIEAGADWVIISAPTKSEDMPTVVHGVNRPDGGQNIISCASCTTNSISPVIEIIGRRIGIKKAMMTTIHGYTASQGIVDGPSKKVRRGRAAAANLVPTSTGAAIATTKTMPEYKGKFDGVAVRVPVPVGSISDVTILTERPTSVEEINQILAEEAATERYDDVLQVSDDELVSSDIIMLPYAAIIDSLMTQVVDGDLVKIMAWYDNEWGYTSQMVREALTALGLREQPVPA